MRQIWLKLKRALLGLTKMSMEGKHGNLCLISENRIDIVYIVEESGFAKITKTPITTHFTKKKYLNVLNVLTKNKKIR